MPTLLLFMSMHAVNLRVDVGFKLDRLNLCVVFALFELGV